MEVIAIVGAAAAVVAAIAAISGLAVSTSARDLAKRDVGLSAQSLEMVTQSSQMAELDRQRAALTEIGRIVEEIAETVGPARSPSFTGEEWLHPCNRLKHAIVGYENLLPRCSSLMNATSRGDAQGKVQMARVEVEDGLRALGH